jgi:hypothetical protein
MDGTLHDLPAAVGLENRFSIRTQQTSANIVFDK